VINRYRTTIARISGALLLGAVLLMTGAHCGNGQPTAPSPGLSIITPHAQSNGRIVWNPNDEPVLVLAVRGEGVSGLPDNLRWQQTGLLTDDAAWTGPVLHLPVDTPGCGFGGQEFTVTVQWPDEQTAAKATVWMEKYLCEGSPWLDE
jgi:hypothetical protein